MRITIMSSPRAKHQLQHQAALAEGLKSIGVDVLCLHEELAIRDEVVACWGWKIGKRIYERGHKVLVMERGYLGDRFVNTSLAWNGLNGYGTFPEWETSSDRFDALNIDIKPWKRKGKYILILGQVPTDASLNGKNIMPWYKMMADKAAEFYNLPVMFRPHPELQKRNIRQAIKGHQNIGGSLEYALANARATICWNSNSSVDSVIAGVPCIVGDAGGMATEMCSMDIEKLRSPRRERWLHELAYKQWTMDEIKSGVPLQKLLNVIS